MIEQFYPWYWIHYDMAEGEGGDDGDGGGDDGGGEGGSGSPSAPVSDIVYQTVVNNNGTTTTQTEQEVNADAGIFGIDPASSQKAPIKIKVIDPAVIGGNKFVKSLVMQSAYKTHLIGGDKEGNISSDGVTVPSYVIGSPGAKFYLEIKDIDDDIIFNLSNVEIPANGQYSFSVIFPKSLATNKYKINLRAGDRTRKSPNLPTTDPMWIIHQRKNPTITFTKSANPTSITASGSDVTFTTPTGTPLGVRTSASQRTRLVNSTTSTGANVVSSVKPFGHFDYTITANAGGSFIYVKSNTVNLTNSTVVEKRLLEKVTNSSILRLGDVLNLEIGMKADLPSYTKTKIYSDGTLLRVSDTINLKAGMSLSGNGTGGAYIVSVDSLNLLTISESINTFDSEQITFSGGNKNVIIKSIDSDLKRIELTEPITLELFEDGYTTLSFYNDEMIFENRVTSSDSGVNSSSSTTSATLTNSIEMSKFGTEDITFTVPLGDIFTLTPNAYNQYVAARKETAIDINVLSGDNDSNVSSKTPAYVTQPTKGIMSGAFGSGDGTVTYTPNIGAVGQDFFKFKVNDGTTDSDIKTVFITITK